MAKIVTDEEIVAMREVRELVKGMLGIDEAIRQKGARFRGSGVTEGSLADHIKTALPPTLVVSKMSLRIGDVDSTILVTVANTDVVNCSLVGGLSLRNWESGMQSKTALAGKEALFAFSFPNFQLDQQKVEVIFSGWITPSKQVTGKMLLDALKAEAEAKDPDDEPEKADVLSESPAAAGARS